MTFIQKNSSLRFYFYGAHSCFTNNYSFLELCPFQLCWGCVLWDMQYTQKVCSFINQCSSVEVITTCRRESRGVGGRGMGILQPPPLEFSKYTSWRTRFLALSGVFLYAHFKNFRLASLTCYRVHVLYLNRKKVYLCHVTIIRQFC